MEQNNCNCQADADCGSGCCQDTCWNCSPCHQAGLPKIGKKVPLFIAEALHDGEIKKISLKEYRGKWVVLFFYPADFTFVCPTELEDLANHYDELKKLNAEVLSVSTDTVYAHKAWHDSSAAVKKIKFPMLADPTGNITRAYGVYIEGEGLALRGTFIIDPESNLRTIEIHDNGIGRSGQELLRKLQAAQFVAKYGDQVCPANWEPGKNTLKPGIDLVGKI